MHGASYSVCFVNRIKEHLSFLSDAIFAIHYWIAFVSRRHIGLVLLSIDLRYLAQDFIWGNVITVSLHLMVPSYYPNAMTC